MNFTADNFPGIVTFVYIYTPDGTQWTSTGVSTLNGQAQFALPSVPTTGTYRVRVEPGQGTGSVSVGLTQNSTGGILSLVEGAISVNLVAGQNGSYTFSGKQGQALGLSLSNFSTTLGGQTVTATIKDSSGTQLARFYPSSSIGYALPVLPMTDTYTMTIDPGTAATNFTLQLTADQTGTLTVNAAPTVFSTNTMGQNASYSFAGVAGQNYALALTADSFPGVTYVYVYAPDGTQWASTWVYPGNGQTQYALPSVPTTGIYTVRVESGQGAGSIAVAITQTGTTTLNPSITGTLTAGGNSIAVNVAAGYTANYTFNGTQGQALGLAFTNFSMTPGGQNVTVTIADSSGTQIASFNRSSASSYALPVLPVTGRYTLTINPGKAATNFTLQLTADQTGALTANGAPMVFSTNMLGQNASYSFAGVAGRNYALNLTADSFPGFTMVYVYAPDGTQWASTEVYSGSGQTQYTLPSVPTTGTYTVRVEPVQGMGSVALGLTQNTTGGIFSIGGPPLNISLIAGQNGSYTFNGKQGQVLGLGFTNISTTPGGQNITVTIADSSGTQIASFNRSSASNYALPILPVTGLYTLTINPGTAAANFTLQLMADQTGMLTVNGAPVVFSASTMGQNASYSFAGVAGRNYALNLTADSFPGFTMAYVYAPDGTQWAMTEVYSGSGQTQYTLPSVPTTGTYAVRVEPVQGAGSVTVGLTQNSTGGILSVGGATLSVNLVAGQNGSYTFNGTQGQALGLGFSNFLTTPAGQNVTVAIADSSGTQIASFNCSSASNYALPTLPVAGFYTVIIDPGTAAASFTLQLTTVPTTAATSTDRVKLKTQ